MKKFKNFIASFLRLFVGNQLNLSSMKKILFTLQITPDSISKAVNENYIKIVENLISANADYLKANDFKLIIRQHPRFSPDHCPSVNLEYDFISFDNFTPMPDLIDDVCMHITFNSTSVFEASMIGLPTIFINMHDQEFPKEINLAPTFFIPK